MCIALASNIHIQGVSEFKKMNMSVLWRAEEDFYASWKEQGLMIYLKELFFPKVLYDSEYSKLNISRKSLSYPSTICWNIKLFNPYLETYKKHRKRLLDHLIHPCQPRTAPQVC